MSKKVNAESINNDKRIINRKLSQGEISEKEVQSILKKLPDVADNAEEVRLDEEEKK
jgi:hypothetical protein